MNIAIVGLGLIGGSYAKSISKFTNHKVYAISHNEESIKKAKKDKTIIGRISECELRDMDMTIVCLPPKATIAFIRDNINFMKDGSVLTDICGVKGAIYDGIKDIYTKYRVNYVGIHPMAGRECSGYTNALAKLFVGKSLIIVEDELTNKDAVSKIEMLSENIGFTTIMHTSREEHDRIIAYTSEMCHITSNAFVKSPTSRMHFGFSGGSFEDLTRVAFLDPKIWTELFSMNRKPLLKELTLYIDELRKYQDALAREDDKALYELLEEGRAIKANI